MVVVVEEEEGQGSEGEVEGDKVGREEEVEYMEGEVWNGPPVNLSWINQERKVEEMEDLPSYRAQVVVMGVDSEVGEVKEVSFKVAIECMIMQLEDTIEEVVAVIMAA